MPKQKRKSKRVFILGGGAAQGAHQVGALRFLEEHGVQPDAIIGSSIGVINACIYASGGILRLEETWKDFRSLPYMISPSWTHNLLLGLSLFSMRRLSRTIESYVDFPRVHESPLEIAFVALNLSRGSGEVYNLRDLGTWQEVRTLMRAGYAVPFVFPPVRYNEQYLVDGGLAWNLPLQYALDIGATEIYILAPVAGTLPYKARFRGLVDLTIRFLDVMWRTIGNMGYLYARMENGSFHGVPVTIIEPSEGTVGFSPLDILDARPSKNRRLMNDGYRDAKKAWGRRPRRGRRRSVSAKEAASA